MLLQLFNPWCSHFALAMQSGAFIQIIVLFAGVSSRMAILLTELGDCVRVCESACDRLLTVLDVSWSNSPSHCLILNVIS